MHSKPCRCILPKEKKTEPGKEPVLLMVFVPADHAACCMISCASRQPYSLIVHFGIQRGRVGHCRVVGKAGRLSAY
jgi:hypothetical protein